MKYISKFKIAVAIFITSILATSCDENDNKEDNNRILNIVAENPELSIFRNALLITNLNETLKQSEPYTIFAPTNDAFKAFLVYSNYQTFEKVPINLLKQLLLNHIVLGNIKSTDLTTGYVKTLATSSISKNNTMSMYVDISSGVKLNGVSKVTTPDIAASNGTIHIVDAIIDLPFIITHAKLNPKLTKLVDVINENAEADFVNKLTITDFYKKGAQKFFVTINPTTIFAPTNDAFASLNTELASDGGIAGVSKENLNKILKYHAVIDYLDKDQKSVFVGNLLASNLADGQKIPSLILLSTPLPPLQPIYEELTIQLTGGAKIKDVKNRISTIEATEIQCWNGVIHLVDKVLLPNL